MYLLKNKGIINKITIRGLFLSKKFLKTNKKQTLIYLRSPKHFNIGKQKVLSFNNKFNYKFSLNTPVLLDFFLKNQQHIIKLILPFFKFNVLFRINSSLITTKFLIRWKKKLKW